MARVAVLLACVPIIVSQVGSAAAAPAQQQPRPPQRIVVVGDSTAVTLFPFLRDAAAQHGITVGEAARIACGVIGGEPKLDDGRPYIDYFGDTSECAAISQTPHLNLAGIGRVGTSELVIPPQPRRARTVPTRAQIARPRGNTQISPGFSLTGFSAHRNIT